MTLANNMYALVVHLCVYIIIYVYMYIYIYIYIHAHVYVHTYAQAKNTDRLAEVRQWLPKGPNIIIKLIIVIIIITSYVYYE